MKRYNGIEQSQVDDVGEVGHINAKLCKSAFNKFLASRGLHTQDGGWSRPFGRFRSHKSKNEIDSGSRGH